ncbi:hypothetical protein NPX13_g8814 [Xylaria arbuscula]|uniref:Uncharacterized protein n=1 Tax=Xylaria arbuscula TaxID=114810 RepID=A0A9W8N7Z4_9PEZI|nr:hypothetical protein NPX13_g8814 [Xylaria arbuscula]
MAKTRKKSRRSRPDFNNDDNSPGNERDRSDDNINNIIDEQPFQRGRGGLRSSNTNSRRKNKQKRGGRKLKNSKLSFIDNPFENPDVIESWYPEPEDSPLGWQQPNDDHAERGNRPARRARRTLE